MMKKTLALVLALLLLAACLAGCGKTETRAPTEAPTPTQAPTEAPAPTDAPPPSSGAASPGNADATPRPERPASPGDIEAPSERTTFTVGFDAEFPPFGFVAADGSYDGFDLAAAAEICARKGWTFVAQPINWDFKDAELSSGSIDCIWNGFTIEGREDAYTWSPAYYDSSVVVVVREGSGIASLADLAGKSVITQAASSGLAALEGNPELTSTFGELLESADYNNAFMELGMGTVDAVVADVGVAEYNMQNKSGSYVVLEEPVSVDTYGIGFLKGNEELMLEVWDEYISLAADGTLAALADKYVPYGLVKENVIHIVPAPSADAVAWRTLIVGFDAEFPPFGFVADDGSYDGFDLAVAQEVCDRLGWTFVAQPINWDFKDAELSSGSIDCIWNGFTIEGREDAYTWSPAYYDSSVVVVVREGSGIASLADLAGKSVITQAASSGLAALEGNPELTSTFGELLESADYNNAFMELGMGTVDAVVADVGVAEYNMQNKSGSYVVLEEPVSVETYGIGFLLGNEELRDTVWNAVLTVAEDGTMASLADKYVPYGLVKENVTLIG